MIQRPHKPDRDIRMLETSLHRQRRKPELNAAGADACAADRESTSREARIRKLICRIRPALARLTGHQREMSPDTKAKVSAATKARRAASS